MAVIVNIPWTIKYEPKKSDDIANQKGAVRAIVDFIKNFKKQKRKCLILYGPTGSGKTASVYAVANELGYEVIEVNASDTRNKEHIDSLVGSAAKQVPLFSKGKAILVDEIEGLSGMEDRGGINALADIIDKTSFPIICTAIDPFDRKFSLLRKKANLVEFSPLNYLDIFEFLKHICKKENIVFDENDLKSLARRSGGDLRAAINDLQILTEGNKKLEKADIEALSDREKTESIQNALLKIFKTIDPLIAISSLENIQEEPDEIILWIDENLPYEYEKPEDLARAYDYISKADIMRRRIKRWQHWRFLVYINAYLSGGIAVSKDEKYRKVVEYGQTKRLLKIWMANQKYLRRKAIAEKIAEKTHTSTKRALQDTLPYIQQIFKKNKHMGKSIADDLELSEEEAEWLAG